jgi:hypothetical protein
LIFDRSLDDKDMRPASDKSRELRTELAFALGLGSCCFTLAILAASLLIK